MPSDQSSSPVAQTIAIIGGGAAGLMAAYFAALNGKNRILLFEKNKYLGAKVIISGGGRCNVTTGISEVSEVLKNYPRGADFLRTAIQAFPPEAVKSWFESQGVALKCEDDLRVFPVSDNGKDVVGALENALRELNVEIHCDAHVTEITPIENTAPIENPENPNSEKFLINLKSGENFRAHKLILTTGGNAYRHTGSTGDGYAFALALGHSITPLAPSLSSFHLAEKWISELSGISFEKSHFTFLPAKPTTPEKSADSKTPKLERTGPFLFTHKGVSGPAIFALSGLAAYQNFSIEKPAKLLIDFFPDLTKQQIEQKLLENFSDHPAKKLLNVLSFTVPHRLAEKLLEHLDDNQTERNQLKLKVPAAQVNCSEVSKALRQRLVQQLKSLELSIVGRGAGDEFVTAGGVPLTEINSKTMESRLTRGLFFAGELIDIDGFTGGFNLQASWATGALAGESAALQ